MIHARKQKAIARAVVLAGGHENVQHAHAHILQRPVLVLNASYEPINICGARRALVLVLKGIARTEEDVLVDAGSAAAHRGWRPKPEELNTMMDVVETFLHRSFILDEGIKKLKAAIPPKP